MMNYRCILKDGSICVWFVFLFSFYLHSQSKRSHINQLYPEGFPIVKKDFIAVSSCYGYRIDPFEKKKKWHEGIDLVASRGKPVYTTAEGVVTDVGYNKGYGNYLKISHWKNIQTLYAHLEISLMHIGDRVKQGQIIGLIGASGKATGPHLHYELWYKGDRIDPIVFWRHIFNANKI